MRGEARMPAPVKSEIGKRLLAPVVVGMYNGRLVGPAAVELLWFSIPKITD